MNGRISKQQVIVISSSYVRLISLDERKAVDDLGNFTLTSIATFELRKSDVMNQIKRLKNEEDLLDRIQSLQSKNDELMLIIDRLSSGVNLSDKDAFKEISRVVSDLESNDSKVRELFNHGSLLEAAEFGDNQTNRNFLDFNVNFVHKIMNGMVVELGMLSFTKNDDDTYDIQVPVKWHVKNNAGLTYLRDKIGLYIKPTMNYLPNAYSVLLDNGNGAKLSSDMRDFLKKKKVFIRVSAGDYYGVLMVAGKVRNHLDDTFSVQFKGGFSDERIFNYGQLRKPLIIKNVPRLVLSSRQNLSVEIISVMD